MVPPSMEISVYRTPFGGTCTYSNPNNHFSWGGIMKTHNANIFYLLMSLFLINLATADNTLGVEPVFTHGVASGDVTEDSAVLWTRVDQKTRVAVEVAYNPDFNVIIFDDQRKAKAKTDFTVKFFPDNLPANNTLYYRFQAGGTTSETGTFKTAPIPTTWSDLKLAYSADSDSFHLNPDTFTFNNFDVLDAIRGEDPDFFVYLGDTIYADSIIKTEVLGLPASTTLEQYRADYKQNRSVQALRDLFQATSFITNWDDHEIEDDWDSVTVDLDQFRDARQAFLEYMPLKESSPASGEDCADGKDPFMRVFHWGRDVDIITLDERSCRSESAIFNCLFDADPGPGVFLTPDLAPTLPPNIRLLFGGLVSEFPPPGCLDAINNVDRTLLGETQKQALKDTLTNSTAKYKLILNQVAIQQFFAFPYDRWEGYAAERKEILNFIRVNNIENVIFLTTDQHANIMNEVFIDRFSDPTPISYEAITGPIATFTFEQGITEVLGAPAVGALNSLLDLVGVDCRNINTDSYGLFEYDAESGHARITLKDSFGKEIKDEGIPAGTCKRLFNSSPIQLVSGP